MTMMISTELWKWEGWYNAQSVGASFLNTLLSKVTVVQPVWSKGTNHPYNQTQGNLDLVSNGQWEMVGNLK